MCSHLWTSSFSKTWRRFRTVLPHILIMTISVFVISSLLLSKAFAQAVINDRLSLLDTKTNFSPTPVQGGPRGTFTITATFQNRSTDNVAQVAFQVAQITGGNLLLNADGGLGGFGSTLTVPLPFTGDYSDGVLSPAQTLEDVQIPGDKFTIAFKIGLASRNKFEFFVNALGVAEPLLLRFAPEDIRQFLGANTTVNSAATFLERLPKEYKQHWIMMSRSESSQTGTATSPRFLVPSRDASVVFGFALDSELIEYLHFVESTNGKPTNKFRFHEIDMTTRTVAEDDGKCQVCHGTPGKPLSGRPNWDSYDSWGGMLPFNRDRIYENSEEAESVKRLLEELKDNPIVKKLELPKGITRDDDNNIKITFDKEDLGGPDVSVFFRSEGNHVTYPGPNEPTTGSISVDQGGTYLTLHHSNRDDPDEGRGTALFDNFTEFNRRRVAQELLDHIPKTPDIRPVALAIARGCVNANNLSNFAAPSFLDMFERHHGKKFPELVNDTRTRRESLPQKKADLQALNLGGDNLACNDQFPCENRGLIRENPGGESPTPETITRQIALRSKEGFQLDKLTKFMIDRELTPSFETENTMIALFRFFLEPLNVAVDKWSMSNATPGRKRNETYTFGDHFSAIAPTYTSQIISELTRALQAEGTVVTQCRDLEIASMKAFPPPPPPPLEGVDLQVDNLACDAIQSLLEFRISNVRDDQAGGFRSAVSFTLRTEDRPSAGGATIQSPFLEGRSSRNESAPIPAACLAINVPLEQRGCDFLIRVDSGANVRETNENNNTANGTCGAVF